MRRPRRLYWLLGLFLVLGALLAPRPSRAYLYEVANRIDPIPVTNLLVADAFRPGGVRIEWDYTPMGAYSPIEYDVERLGSTGNQSWVTTNKYLVDNGPLTVGVTYTYRVRVRFDANGASMGLPAPPPNANPADIYSYSWFSPVGEEGWYSIQVVLQEQTAGDNQAVDSRWDLRYGNPTYLDFLFQNRTWKGGLWAGYAADGSRVGRSFLKFSFPSSPSTGLWYGSTYAYHTASATSAAVTVGAQKVADTWLQGTVKWTNAPALTPLLAPSVVVLTNQAGAGWIRWVLLEDLVTELYGDRVFSLGLATLNEATVGWGYFAKKEYDATRGPRVLYAVGAPLAAPLRLSCSPGTLTPGGGAATAKVVLTSPAPTGGALLTLSNPDGNLVAPSTVTVPAGTLSTTFSVSAQSGITQNTTGTLVVTGGLTRRLAIPIEL
ncbi:MAG: hypothetical protein FJX77_00345 [Armatimonadetes bacterium]|nr:hypothetical protein [Armatimonadota bacterium]